MAKTRTVRIEAEIEDVRVLRVVANVPEHWLISGTSALTAQGREELLQAWNFGDLSGEEVDGRLVLQTTKRVNDHDGA